MSGDEECDSWRACIHYPDSCKSLLCPEKSLPQILLEGATYFFRGYPDAEERAEQIRNGRK